MSSVAEKPEGPERPREPGRAQIAAPNRTVVLIVIITIILGIIFGRYNQAARAVRQEYFMSNEIILAGAQADIETLLEELQDVNPNIVLTIDQERSYSLESLIDDNEEVFGAQTVASASLQIGTNIPDCNALSRELSTLEINLYKLTGSVDDVEAVLAAIDNTTAGENVFSEANWVIGAPWSPTGSPWSPTGSPWSPTGSTDQGNPKPATTDDFWAQWAFQTIGMADTQAQNNSGELSPVRVGVFDTSPFETETVQTETVQSLSDTLEIETQHPPFINTPVPPKPGSREDIEVSNHGYFVSGFIRALTPTSEIQLIRVLTKNNRGDLATLNYQLLTFMGAANNDGINSVVNMSLGVPPLEPFRPFAPLLDWEFPPPFELERQLNSLQIIAQIGECLDVVMVAAAGNDSYESLKVSNYPANWGTVVGVTASNQQNEQACYANDGDVAAPGGDGGPSEPTADDPIACEPKLHLCKDPDCQYSVIGFVHPDTVAEDAPSTTHHHWVGTSFAAPMVSGLAALLRQLDSSLTAAEIREAIRCGAVKPIRPQQVPVINVQRTLDCAGNN